MSNAITRQLVEEWDFLIRRDPTAMSDQLWDSLSANIPEPHRTILKHLIDGYRHQVRWISEAGQRLNTEVGRAEEIGKMMKRAGLRSYTDKDGRVYVAAEDRT